MSIYVFCHDVTGSNTILRYTMNELGDKFALMCVTFGQPLYKVDKDLNIIEPSE